MPRRLPTPCARPGCPAVSRSRFCTAHATDEHRRDQATRGTAAARGYDRRHRRWRKVILARDPTCRMCLLEGRVTAATVADHVVPLEDGGDWSYDNGQGLCRPCHNRKTARETAARRAV